MCWVCSQGAEAKTLMSLRLDSVGTRWTWACIELATAAADVIRSQRDVTWSTSNVRYTLPWGSDQIKLTKPDTYNRKCSKNTSAIPAYCCFGHLQFHSPLSEKRKQFCWLFPTFAFSLFSLPLTSYSPKEEYFCCGLDKNQACSDLGDVVEIQRINGFRSFLALPSIYCFYLNAKRKWNKYGCRYNIGIDIVCVYGCIHTHK